MEKFWIFFLAAIVSLYPPTTIAYLNVFINHKQVIKLIGLEADLFYVHEGAINTYALQFTVPVPADVVDLEFSWQSLTSYQLPYVISIEYETGQNVLSTPSLNISSKGYVPQNVETFIVHLPCTGNVSDQVPVIINMFVKGPPRTNHTRLAFKRNKICKKDNFNIKSLAPSIETPTSNEPAQLDAIICAIVFILIAVLIVSAIYVHLRKKIQEDSLHPSFTTAAYGSHQNVFIRLDPLGRPPSANSGSYATIASLNKFPLAESKKSWFRRSPTPSPYATAFLPIGDQKAETIYAKPESTYPSMVSFNPSAQLTLVNNMATPRKIYSKNSDPKDELRRIPCVQTGTLCFQHLIKEGTYGKIYVGKLGESCDILIKTVEDGASLTQVACLLLDVTMLIGVSHQNVLAPIVANLELPGPPQIAYPNPNNGNLKIFLQKSQETNLPLKTRIIVEFAMHITKGLAHLHSIGIVHKDIAARNCFLDVGSYVKICDGALSKDLFPDEYNCLGDEENRPIKWMALETLQSKIYSKTSDIWSLGVLFWELTTMAAIPFQDVDIYKLESYLCDGFRLGQPINCPDEFYTVMSCCWLSDPMQRPSFPQLLAYLEDFREDLNKYI